MIKEIKTKLAELENSIRKYIIGFLKDVELQDYPCDIFLGGEPDNVVTELILNEDEGKVEVLVGGRSCELHELSVEDQLTILEAISTE